MKKIILIIILIFALVFVYRSTLYNPLPQNSRIIKIIIDKKTHKMTVYTDTDIVKVYKVALGRGVYGIKDTSWDNITPSGNYYISFKNPNSNYHKALGLSYGNDIEIHGIKNGWPSVGNLHTLIDWTRGCIAVSNIEIDDIYRHTAVGTIVSIE